MMVPGGKTVLKMLLQERAYSMTSLFLVQMVRLVMLWVLKPGLKPGRV